MTRLLTLSLALCAAALCAGCHAPRCDVDALSRRLTALAEAFDGDVGIYVERPADGVRIAVDADEVFPTASIVKVPILVALLERVERGELDYHQELTYTKDRLYPGEDLVGAFADGAKVTLDKVAMLMITTSDNTGALWCQELAGTGTKVNELLAREGFEQTRVNSRTEGREEARKSYGWGQTTPREMARMFLRIAAGELVSPAASEEMQRVLCRIYWDGEALSQIPPEVQTLSKQGAVNRSRSEVVLVHAPHGDYVFCVITKDQRDTSWEHGNAGYVLLREVSAACWRAFEPDWPYEPPAGSERFR